MPPDPSEVLRVNRCTRETRRGARDCAGDLAHLPAVRLPAHVDSAVNQAYIEY